MNRIDTAEVAKLVRRALKEAFPTQKFSVRTERYSMGSSLNVSWTDGPRATDVNNILRLFEAKRFNGMDDSTTYVQHVLDGETVSFGSDYVQGTRSYSAEFLTEVGDRLTALRRDNPTEFTAFLNSIHHRGDVDRDWSYLVRSYASGQGTVEPKGSVLATAIILANPFLVEEKVKAYA